MGEAVSSQRSWRANTTTSLRCHAKSSDTDRPMGECGEIGIELHRRSGDRYVGLDCSGMMDVGMLARDMGEWCLCRPNRRWKILAVVLYVRTSAVGRSTSTRTLGD